MILAGAFEGSFSIDGHKLDGSADAADLFVAKFARQEERRRQSKPVSVLNYLDWLTTADGPIVGSFEQRLDVAVTPHGNVLVTGAFPPSAQFGDLKLVSGAEADGFVACIDADGPHGGKLKYEERCRRDPEGDECR